MNDKIFSDLEASVMFNLSLGSKELFHSNFLAYLFRCDNSLFCEIIGEDLFEFHVKREHKNIDIEIIGKRNNKKYLIENKVKDIIEIEQIQKIQEQENKGYEKFYLFSLLGNNLKMIDGEISLLWEEIGYEKIIEKLKTHHFPNSYLEEVKNDYCSFTSNVVSLINEQYIDCANYIIYWEKNQILKKIREIRMHDVFLKYGMSHFISYFRKNTSDCNIKSTYGINRAKATMTFSKEFNGLKYGIQTEDQDYRRFVVTKKDDDIQMCERNGWFDKNWKSLQKKPYLKYGEDFYYQNRFGDRKIKDISYDELLKWITDDIKTFDATLK